MIIAFASDDNRGIEGILAYHFGRCPYFTFVEVDDNSVKNVTVENNPYADSHEPGVVPEYIHSKGAEMIVAGGMGPRAQEWFSKLGVRPVVGGYGRIRDIVEQIMQGPVKISTVPIETEQEHTEQGSEEIDRLKKEVTHLREVIADLNERLRRVENK